MLIFAFLKANCPLATCSKDSKKSSKICKEGRNGKIYIFKKELFLEKSKIDLGILTEVILNCHMLISKITEFNMSK